VGGVGWRGRGRCIGEICGNDVKKKEKEIWSKMKEMWWFWLACLLACVNVEKASYVWFGA